jgi:hypothetical protein
MTNPVSLYVDGIEWQFAIDEVVRTGRDLYIHVSLASHRDRCTMTVHVHDGIVIGETAREILNGTCAWLMDRRQATHGYLELASAAPTAADRGASASAA